MFKGTEKFKDERKFIILNILAVICFILIWEFLLSNPTNVKKINDTIFNLVGWNPGFRAFSLIALPKPSSIVKAFFITPINGRGGPMFFWTHTIATISAIIQGFLIGNFIAILGATIFLYVPQIERAVMPFNLALQSIPLVAITPILLRIRFSLADSELVQNNPILYSIFGTEHAIKIFLVVIIVFFPTLVNAFQGLRSVESASLELMESLSASKWYIYWNLRIPSALPLTFSALKIAASASVGGVIVAEWFSSNTGLGYIMAASNSAGSLTTADLWVALIIATLLSVVIFWGMNALEKAVIPWHESVIALKEAMTGSTTE
jgi:NitT/TauT family transport system permease protein